jgi:hypothetical protein
VIRDPLMEAKEYLLSNKEESWREHWNKKKGDQYSCIREGRRMKHVIKKSWTTRYYMINPNMEQKERIKKQNNIIDNAT